MSAVSGLTSKGENKSKQKYQSLNINNLYKGKSLENPKTSVAPKHGLQTLGKVGAGRRMPPPANLPSLKSQNSGNNSNITLVPTGGQGWGSGKEEDSGATPPLQTSSSGQQEISQASQNMIINQSNQLQTSSNTTIVTNVGVIASGVTSAALTAASKTWSNITAIPLEESGPDKTFLAQQSPFFPQEFPKLIGGHVQQDSTLKANIDLSYGPGPSLRPQTEGSWGRGTMPQTAQQGLNQSVNQALSPGNGVSGQQSSSPPLPNDQNLQQVSRSIYPQSVTGLPQQRPPIPGSVAIMPATNQTTGPPLIPGQPMNAIQYRMMSQYMYPRGAYPVNAFQPQGYPHPPQPGALSGSRPPYFPDSRIRQRLDDESGARQTAPPPPIITDKDLKGFDDILENEVQAGWAAANTEIDYNAKLVFSDDEDSIPLKESNYDENRDRIDNKQKAVEWEQRDRDFNKDERNKYRSPQQQQQWQQQIPPNPRVGYNDYSQNAPQSQTAIPPPFQRPQQIHTNYPHSRHGRSEMVADDDEMWRQRSRQQSDEMAAAVVRARQRREEEEKKMERSRQAALEKLKALEEKASTVETKDKDSLDFDQCSRHSSESKDDKVSVRDSRDMRPSANYANSFTPPKQYPKNVPPRFQKQAELMRQQQTNQQTNQTAQSPPYDQRLTHSLSRLPQQDTEQRGSVTNQVSNSTQLSNKTPPIADSSRSDSQISSGHESYDSERERQTPEYDSICSKDKRVKQQSGFDSTNWRAIQTQQRHQTNDSKDMTDNSRSIESYDNEKSNQTSQRDVSKRVNEESTQIVTKSDYITQKNRPEIRDTKPRDDTIDSRETIVEKRSLIERQESSQSSQSDKRSSSSKDDRYIKKYERLDWASECDNVSISSYGKRDRHRHVPITQKQFESITEPIKKNFTPLKKLNTSNVNSINDDSKDGSLDKPKDIWKKSQTPPPIQSVINTETFSQRTKTNVTDLSKVQIHKEEPHVELGSKKDKDNDRHYERGYNKDRDKDGLRKDSTKDDKNVRKSNSNRYDSYQNRGRYSGVSTYRGRGREYRRTRGSSEKSSYPDSKTSSSPSNSRNKNNKLRRKSNSDESYVSEELNKKESLKTETDKLISSSISSNIKESKQEDREKGSPSDPIISTSVTSSVLPNQRNDPSRRGRGAVAFKNSTRGLPRTYGPSNYGPPPSRAAFGDGSVKSDVPKNSDQNRNERNIDSKHLNDFQQSRVNSSKSNRDDMYLSSYSNSQSNRVSHDNNRNSVAHNRKAVISGNRSTHNAANSSVNNRSEQLPPRFQKRHNNGSQRGGRTRNWNQRSGSTNANQVESDVTNNEEWETASESSDIAERNDRKSNKKSSHYSEPRNDNRNYSRKSDNRRNDYPRGQYSSGTQSSSYRGGRNRNPVTNSLSSTRGGNANNLSPNQQRNGSLTSSNVNNENITVCSLSDVTLDNPTAVEEALSDIKSRVKASDDYIDDHNSETEDGFQTVTYKKRNRLNQGNNSKKLKQETSLTSKLIARNRQCKLAPRFAKQKENNRLNKLSDEAFTTTSSNLTKDMKSLSIDSKYADSCDRNTKDRIENNSKNMPNAWSKPLSHSSQTTASNSTVTTTAKTVMKTTNSISHDIQALSISSKSSSFDQHDSGIDVSDQPPSTASSQRSSPSNDDNKVITTTAKANTTIESRTDTVSDIDTAKPMCTVIFENTRYKEENKVLAKIAPAKSPSAKDMYINTTTVSSNVVVTETLRTSQAMNTSKKNDSVLIEEFPINEKNQSSNVAKVVGMQRLNVLPTDDLNMKIASVKKVWENTPSMTPVIEQTNDNSKNVLLSSFEENKIKANVSHSNDPINNSKVSKSFQSNQMTTKTDYSSVDSMNTLNKGKQQGMTYTSPTQVSSQSHLNSHQSQASLISSQQIIMNPLSSPPLDSIRSLSGVQTTFQVHNIAHSPAISSPPTMLYNTQVAAHNVYQTFGQQIETLHQSQMPTVMAQFGPQQASGHYGQQHLIPHQQNTLNQANMYLAAHHLGQSSATAEQYKLSQVAAHQQTLANSILKSQYVHQNNTTLQHTLSNPAWTTASGHTQANTQTANYYPQSSSVGTALQPHQQHYAFQSQPSLGLLSAQSSQALLQQQYRATPLSIGRTTAVDNANPMAANLRTMFSANIPINDMKIGTSVHQTLDTRNANNRTSYNYSQASNLQQLQQQQQIYANQQKYAANRAILPLYQHIMSTQQMSARSNSVSVLSSNINSANSYTTPIQRPKLNRNNQSYIKNSYQTHHQQPQQQQQHQQQQHQQIQQQTHAIQPQATQVSSQLSTAQQAKMRHEAVLQTQSFFAQSTLPLNKIESQLSDTQRCAEVSKSVTNDCLTTTETSVKAMTDEKSKQQSNNSTEKNEF